MQLVVMSSMLRTPRGNTMLGMAFSRRLWLQSIAISSAMASTLDANAKEHCYTDSILAKNKKCKRSSVLSCLVTLCGFDSTTGTKIYIELNIFSVPLIFEAIH